MIERYDQWRDMTYLEPTQAPLEEEIQLVVVSRFEEADNDKSESAEGDEQNLFQQCV